jgi:CubicO group peptidase (beta-lactamase class C family)
MRVAAILAILLTLPSPGIGTNSEERVNQLFSDYDKADTPGCAVGVIRNGNFVYRKGYGTGSLELDVPLSSQSVFYMGSVAKQFTAASLVLAAEQGYLSLDDNVRKYIPEIPDYGQPVTLRQMLHHTSGFADILGLEEISGRNFEDLHPHAELMDVIVRQKALNFKPGDEYQYSNTNYLLLAEVLKRAAKKPLPEFAAENIFKPLKMAHTRFYDDHAVVVPGRVAAYRPGKNGAFLIDWSTNYDNIGGGGLMSSVDDLLLWDRNFYDNKLGKGTLLNELQTPGMFNSGAQNVYALGLFISSYRGLPTVDHEGGMFGYRTDILRFPQQRFTVVTLCNISTADPGSLSRKIADIYLEKELKRPPSPDATLGSDPAPFAGKYFDKRTHFPVSFTVEDGKLILEGHQLQPVETNKFEDPIIGGVVTFSGSNGAKKATVVYNNQVSFAGTKIEDLHVDDGTLASYAGVYRNAELDATYKLSVEQGNPMLRMNWNPAIKVQPLVPNEFSAADMTLVFHKDSNNRVSDVTVFAGWNGWIRNERFEKAN